MGTIRILQLLDHPAEFEARRSADALRRALGGGFEVEQRMIGTGGGDFRDAATALAALRRSNESFHVVHAWGGAALAVAVMSVRCPIVYSPLPDTGDRTVGWLRAAMNYRDVHVVCATSTMRKRFVTRGVPLDRCHLVRPGVDFSLVNRRRDHGIRAQLGFTDADNVLFAPGETTRNAGHEHSLWTSAVLHVADGKYKLLLWGRGPAMKRLEHFARSIENLTAVCFAEPHLRRKVELEELLAAADTVLVNATGPVATLPIATCMAAALPIIASTSYTVAELLEDRHTALMTTTTSPRELSRRVLDLHADSSLQWSISDMARTEAYEFFAQTRFVSQFRTVYQQVAAKEKVDVPEQRAGAGLRFHGRG